MREKEEREGGKRGEEGREREREREGERERDVKAGVSMLTLLVCPAAGQSNREV